MLKQKLILSLLFAVVGLQCNAQYATHSRLSQGSWWKIGIDHAAIYRVTPNDIPELLGRECGHIALYGNPHGPLSLSNADPYTDDLYMIPIELCDKNSNGRFDQEDYILFYGEGSGVWRFDNRQGLVVHTSNPFASSNYYFLTSTDTDGKRIQHAASLTANQPEITRFTITALIESDLTNINKSGQLWVGESFSTSIPSRTFQLGLDGIVSGSPISILSSFACVTNSSARFDLRLGATTRSLTLSPLTAYRKDFFEFTAGSDNSCAISFSSNDNQSTGYLDYLQANALANIHFNGTQRIFFNLDQIGEGNVSPMRISASEPVTIWDVTDSALIVGNNASFTITTDKPRTLVAFTPSKITSPTDITPLPNQDLHGNINPDMIVVTHPDLQSQARRIETLHEVLECMEVLVVTPDKIYNEYSSGRQDPMALRHLLRTYWKRWQDDTTLRQPKYLLLMGHGTYDNRNLRNINSTWMLTYESEESMADEGGSWCSDDLYGYMHDNEQGRISETLDIAIGRIPAANADQAKLVVDKIERYMTNADLFSETDNRGDWRNYITLLADDADPSCEGDTTFAASSEITARLVRSTFPNMNIDRIYADAYIQQSGAIGSYYPDVNNALTKRINSGTLLLNYIGHGSERYIGTERYMEQSDIAGYTNFDKQTFFVTSTCSFGHYDNPEVISGAEAFLLAKGGGIGVVSAARPIAHVQRFNTAVCTNALTPGTSIGDALRKAKNQVASPHCITLFGDPALKLSIPENQIKVTKINGRPISETVLDTAMVLTEVSVEGEVVAADGSLMDDFHGTIYPIVFDRETKTHTLANDNPGTEVNFVQQKSVLYKGVATVQNGRFQYHFIVPRDVAFQYEAGRISHYARSLDGEQASGNYSRILFGGFNEDADLTESHPTVRLFIGDTNFIDGGLADENPRLVATLFDTLGINSFGSGLGHDIVATLDNNPNNPIILNDFYEQDLDNPSFGSISYQMSHLAPGPHTLTLRAWNIYNYSGSDTIHFVVQPGTEAAFGEICAYPNPTNGIVSLRLPTNGSQQVQHATLQLFSSRGQRVLSKTLTLTDGSYLLGPVQLDLSSLSRGIYLASIIVTTSDGQTIKKTTRVVKQ